MREFWTSRWTAGDLPEMLYSGIVLFISIDWEHFWKIVEWFIQLWTVIILSFVLETPFWILIVDTRRRQRHITDQQSIPSSQPRGRGQLTDLYISLYRGQWVTIIESQKQIGVSKDGNVLLYSWPPHYLSIYIFFHYLYVGTYSVKCDQNNEGKLEGSHLFLSI